MQKFIKDYILDNEFRLILFNDRLNIINYKELLEINNKEIVISNSNGRIYVYGNNLVLNKLLDKEILISGNILKIEVKYE